MKYKLIIEDGHHVSIYYNVRKHRYSLHSGSDLQTYRIDSARMAKQIFNRYNIYKQAWGCLKITTHEI